MIKIKKIGVFLLSLFVLTALIPKEAFAASSNVSVSSVSGTVGSTVTVTCTASMSGTSIGAADVTLWYDSSALSLISGSCTSGASGVSGSIYYSNGYAESGHNSMSFSFSLKILKEGSFAITITSAETWAYDQTQYTPSKSNGSVTGKAVTSNSNPSGGGTTPSTNPGTTQTNKDTNNKLKSLQISPGSLSPAFNANTTSYKVNVPEGTTELVVSAAAQSSKANVSVTGHKNIKPGENTVKVVVLSESGATRVYTLTVICGEATTNEEPQEEPEKIQINGADYTINEAFADDSILSGFVRTKITYNGKEYEALKHEKGDLLLVNLQNEVVNAFYIFNAETQEFYDFIQISFSEGRYIIPLKLDDRQEFADADTTTIMLQDKPFDAWKVDEEYSVIRAMNSEGEIVLYQYDSLDGTLQRYAAVVANETEEEPEETEMTFFTFLEKYYLYIIVGLGVVILALIIALICVVVKKRNTHHNEHDYHVQSSYVESKKQLKKEEKQPKKAEKQLEEVEQQPKKKRKHDARRRKAIKRLQKQQMKENK